MISTEIVLLLEEDPLSILLLEGLIEQLLNSIFGFNFFDLEASTLFFLFDGNYIQILFHNVLGSCTSTDIFMLDPVRTSRMLALLSCLSASLSRNVFLLFMPLVSITVTVRLLYFAGIWSKTLCQCLSAFLKI